MRFIKHLFADDLPEQVTFTNYLDDPDNDEYEHDTCLIFRTDSKRRYYFTDEFSRESRITGWEVLGEAIRNGEKFLNFKTLREARVYYLMKV